MVTPERRVSRVSPQARLRQGWLGYYPTLRPDVWYPLHTAQGNHPVYVWVQASHGLVRVQRTDLDIRDVAPGSD